jgi:hypothetical protein
MEFFDRCEGRMEYKWGHNKVTDENQATEYVYQGK